MENSIPTITTSPISIGVNLNCGTTYINAPLDIKTGGRIIFNAFVGFFAAFMRTNKASIPIKTAPIEETTTKFIGPIPYYKNNAINILLYNSFIRNQ
jgi:hypothetical protein